MDLTSLDDERKRVTVAYYGDPGSGKSTNIASGARLGRTLVVAAEDGLKPRPLRNLGVPVEKIVPVRNAGNDELTEAIWMLRSDLDSNPDSWAALGFDSVTEMIKALLAQVVDTNYEKERARADRRGEEYDKSPYFVSRDYYGQVTEMFRRVLRGTADLPLNVAFSAHVRRDVDEDDGTVKYGPALPPAAQSELIGFVDVLMLTRRLGEYADGTPIHVGISGGGGKYQTKDRLGVLPRVMADPTLDRIVAYNNGELTEETDPVQMVYRTHVQKIRDERRTETTKEN